MLVDGKEEYLLLIPIIQPWDHYIHVVKPRTLYGNILLRSLTKQLILFAFSMPMHTYKAKLCMKQNIQYISVHEKKQYYFVTKKN